MPLDIPFTCQRTRFSNEKLMRFVMAEVVFIEEPANLVEMSPKLC